MSSGERAKVTAPTADALVRELSGAARLLLAQDEGIQQFQEARALFEIGLAASPRSVRPKRTLSALREALEANGRAIGNRPEFMRTDVAFHYAIAAIPRNPIFTSMYNAVVEWLTEQREISRRVRIPTSPIEHEHKHVHDEHHQHAHDGPVTEPHTHSHRHEGLRHRHGHYPDLHHRHEHG